MMGRREGFTIIEVILFLAISSVLFLIAITAMTSTIDTVRFQDATKTTESFIERQFSAVQTSSVPRPDWDDSTGKITQCSATGAIQVLTAAPGTYDSRGNSNNCVLLGAELVFENLGAGGSDSERVHVFPILGYVVGDAAGSTLGALEAANPRVLTEGAPLTYTLPSGARFTKLATPLRDYTAVAIMRSPTSESINLIYHDASYDEATGGNVALLDLRGMIEPDTHRNLPAVICIDHESGGDLRGAIVFDGKQNAQNFSISSISSSLKPKTEPIVSGIDCDA